MPSSGSLLRDVGVNSITVIWGVGESDVFYMPQVKAKSIPLQAWTVPEGYRRMRLPDFKILGT